MKALLQRLYLAARGVRPSHAFLVFLGLAACIPLACSFIPPPNTLGAIHIGGPEIYTRERLVNDRFQEDSWLSNELVESKHAKEALSRTSRIRSSTLTSGATSSQEKESLPAPPNVGEASSSSLDSLKYELDYRDHIRNLLIENQLDDRHDLDGNSLYKLKFDASIVPGENTRRPAWIEITLTSPDFIARSANGGNDLSAMDKSVLDGWRTIYRRWLESLETRLNQSHAELKRPFITGEFTHNDYAGFLAFVASVSEVKNPERLCGPDQFRELSTRRQPGRRLSTEERAKRRSCVAELIRSRNKGNKGFYASPPPPSALGTPTEKSSHPNGKPPPGRPDTLFPVAGPEDGSEIESLTRLWLDAYLGVKAVKLVLGLDLPLQAFTEYNYTQLPTLQPLLSLSSFFKQEDPRSENFFSAQNNLKPIRLLDPGVKEKDFKDGLAKIASDPRYSSLWNLQFADFVPFRATGTKIYRRDLMSLGIDQRATWSGDRVEKSPVPGLSVAHAEIGLQNFIERAQQLNKVFTYAVTPKANADLVFATVGSRIRGEAMLPEGFSAMTAGDVMSSAMNQRSVVVGFSDGFSSSERAKFGWIINPRLLSRHGTTVHASAQYPVSALVSIPSWWSEIRLEIDAGWLEEDGTRKASDRAIQVLHVSLPADYEALEQILLQIQQLGPELMESHLDPIRLTACKPASVLIPGKRMWRTSVVTVGAQRADEIFVLPNMKGIIASYRSIASRAPNETEGNSSDSVGRTVRVWTSQGVIALPDPAVVSGPENCADAESQ
jgi:hypothetical protein